MPTRLLILNLLAALVACGPKDEPITPGSTSGSTGSSGDVPTSTTTGPTEGTSEGTTGDALADEFGFICIELAVGEAVEGDPFVGTAKVVAKLAYEPCLIDYYTNKHPEMRLDGPADAGGAVFAAWKQRLCGELDAQVPCTVESFEQILNEGNMLYSLAVTYTITDPGALVGLPLLWGPAPLASSAECDADLQPFAKLTGLSDVTGVDANDAPLWRLQSFGPTPRGLVGSDVTGCLQLPVTPN